MVTLFPWQEAAAQRQLELLRSRGLVLNLSSTGIGKTFMTAWGLHELALPALVVCPKTVIPNWTRVLEMAGVPIEGVINWEALRTGTRPWWDGSKWVFKRAACLVVDEPHRGASGVHSQCTRMLAMLRAYSLPKVLLSATLASTPLALRGIGFLAGLHQFNEPSFYEWCLRVGCIRVIRNTPYGKKVSYELPRTAEGAASMARLYADLSPYMVRLTPDDAPGFPETEVVSKLFTLEADVEAGVAAEYQEVANAIKNKSDDPRAIMTKARRRSEICKVPIFKDLVQDAVAEGRSVVVFLNFRTSMSLLAMALGEGNIVQIHGDQSNSEREEAKALFQANAKPICLAQVQAGGISIDLHDIHHVRPRTAFISPSFSVSDMIQCMGRVWRAGGTKSLQMFVMLRGTIEEKTHEAILRKRACLDALSTGELWGCE